uniref:Putative G-box-binding factor 1 n=1 Tax=Davidia involucrata TaxID=16924 RepID=A0A5B7B8W4_DAVIN
MEAGEESSWAKSSKPTALTQEMPTTPLYTDWSASMQAYYGAGATPPHFFASPVASPAPHPFLWGSQHPMVPPYGTPLPYPALYPHGGLYAHPNMAVGVALTNTEAEGKATNGKDPAITSLTGGKSEESGKAASVSGNDDLSQSAESASDGSSEGSDENGNQQASSATKKRSFNQMLPDESNTAVQYNGENPSASVTGKPAMPTTNLNIGWDASPSGATPMKMRPNASGASPQVAPATHDHYLVKLRLLKAA